MAYGWMDGRTTRLVSERMPQRLRSAPATWTLLLSYSKLGTKRCSFLNLTEFLHSFFSLVDRGEVSSRSFIPAKKRQTTDTPRSNFHQPYKKTRFVFPNKQSVALGVCYGAFFHVCICRAWAAMASSFSNDGAKYLAAADRTASPANCSF